MIDFRSVSEVVRWYLTTETMSFYSASSATLHPHCGYHGAAEADLVTFAGHLSFELVQLGREWRALLGRARGASAGLVLLLGAGGVVVYLLQGRRPPSPRSRADRQADIFHFIFNPNYNLDINFLSFFAIFFPFFCYSPLFSSLFTFS